MTKKFFKHQPGIDMNLLKYYKLLAMTLLLTGCSQNEEWTDAPEPGASENKVEISVNAPSERDSRVSYDDSSTTPFAWEEGDQLLVVGLDAGGAYKGQVVFDMKGNPAENGKKATFSGHLIDEATRYKLYYKAKQLSFSATDNQPVILYGSQLENVTSPASQTAHLKHYLQLATPEIASTELQDPNVRKTLRLENSLLRIEVKSYPEGVGHLQSVLLRTNAGTDQEQSVQIGITNDNTGNTSFPVFLMFDPAKMENLANNKWEVVFKGSMGSYAVSHSAEAPIFNEKGKRYHLIVYQNESEIQGLEGKAALNNWTGTTSVIIDQVNHTLTTTTEGSINLDMIKEAVGNGDFLKVVGPVNGTDFNYIRIAAGCIPVPANPSEYPKPSDLPFETLKLDLSEAICKKGGTYTVVSDFIFQFEKDNTLGNTLFYNANGEKAGVGYRNLVLKEITLPQNLESIGESAFLECTLTSISIPTTVQEIGNSAFSYCQSLTEIVIPEKVTSLGSSAFSNCRELQIAVIRGPITQLPNSLFQGCTALENFEIPPTVKSIGSNAFMNTNLGNITLPEGLEEIGRWSLQINNMDTLVIPAGVKTVGEYICNPLSTIKILGTSTVNGEPRNFSEIAFSNLVEPTCDLVLDASWKKDITQENGVLMFKGGKFKSVKDFDGNDLIPGNP